MKHKPRISGEDLATEDGIITPSELADRLCELRYDGLADYLVAIARQLEDDSSNDGGRGRGKLSHHLYLASAYVRNAVGSIEDAWDICEPYMEKNK